MINGVQNSIEKFSTRHGRTLGLDLSYLIKNSFWVVIRQGVTGLSGLILSIFFVRIASQQIFGEYQFILSILSIISILSLPGLNTAVAQSVARGHDGDYVQSVKMSFLWSLFGVPLLLTLGGYYYFYQNQSIGLGLMLASIFFPFMYAPNTWDSFLQGKSRFDVATRYALIQAIINTGVTLTAIYFESQHLLVILGASLFSSAFFNAYYFRRSLRYVTNEKQDGEVFGYGNFLTKIIFLRLVAANIDQILVGILLGPVALAIYSVIGLVAIKLKDVLKNFSALLVPKFSTMEQSFVDFFLVHKKKLVGILVFQAIFAAVFFLCIPYLNRFLFTDRYDEYGSLAQWFSLTIFLAIPLSFVGYYIEARKNKFALLMTNPLFFTLKIIINLLLIYSYGLTGAVWAFNISTLLWFLFSIWGILWGEAKENGVLRPTAFWR